MFRALPRVWVLFGFGPGRVWLGLGRVWVRFRLGSGSVRARSGFGSVRVWFGSGSVRARPGLGSVRVRLRWGSVRARPGLGSVRFDFCLIMFHRFDELIHFTRSYKIIWGIRWVYFCVFISQNRKIIRFMLSLVRASHRNRKAEQIKRKQQPHQNTIFLWFLLFLWCFCWLVLQSLEFGYRFLGDRIQMQAGNFRIFEARIGNLYGFCWFHGDFFYPKSKNYGGFRCSVSDGLICFPG